MLTPMNETDVRSIYFFYGIFSIHNFYVEWTCLKQHHKNIK